MAARRAGEGIPGVFQDRATKRTRRAFYAKRIALWLYCLSFSRYSSLKMYPVNFSIAHSARASPGVGRGMTSYAQWQRGCRGSLGILLLLNQHLSSTMQVSQCAKGTIGLCSHFIQIWLNISPSRTVIKSENTDKFFPPYIILNKPRRLLGFLPDIIKGKICCFTKMCL